MSGQRAAVVGRVTAVASFSRGYRFTLSDDSGQVTLLMWDNVYDDCWDAPQINLGAAVWALGEVGYFEGELQIVPSFGGHVKVNAAASPPPPTVEIGSLGERVGQRVTVVGNIERVEGNNSGQTLFLRDESGEIAVFIWQNTFDRIPHRAQLTPGTRARVVGPVSIFRNNRQIVPTLPYDVVVLP
jgi:RecJ-like exonuclease